MFARIVRVALKPGQGDGYTRATEQKVLPILQKFAGFQHQIGMVSADGREGIGISLWHQQEDADAYERAAYGDVLKILEPFMTGKPEVHKYPVTTSTVHERARAGKT